MRPASESPATGTVGLIGAGWMGVQLGAQFVGHGLRLVIADANPQTLADAPRRIAAEIAEIGTQDCPPVEACPGLSQFSGHHAPSMVGENGTVPFGNVEVSADMATLAKCDLVLESVTENPAVKRQVYAQVEPHLAAGAVLGTNTSVIAIRELAAGLAAADRFCGIHFCHPVRRRPLVEIVAGPQTAADTVARAVQFACAIGKMPILVKDAPGFLINRLLFRYLNEATSLLLDGAAIEQVDAAATGFGMAFGPLRMMDEIGLDTALHGGRLLRQTMSDRITADPLLVLLFKRGQLGRKVGQGFYRYPSAVPEPEGPNPAALDLIAHCAAPRPLLSGQEVLNRLLLSMLLEATLILEEGRVADPQAVDLGVLFGLGFPHEQGGLLYWADTLGIDRILEMLRPLEMLGPRLRPTPLLLEMGKQARRFYG